MMKKVAGTLRLDLAQYRELAAFSQFASDLDEATRKQLSRGERLVELLKQAQYAPADDIDQVISIYAGTKGMLDSIPASDITKAEKEMIDFMKSKHSDLRNSLAKENVVSDENEKKLVEAIKTFVSNFKA